MSTWIQETAADSKHPVYYMKFDGDPTLYSTGRIKNPSGPVKVYMKSIGGITQKIEPLEGKASIGGIEFALLDGNNDITNLVSTLQPSPVIPSLINRRKTFFGGYAPIDGSEYQQIFVGQSTAWSHDSQNRQYRFKTSDIKRATLDEINKDTTEAAPTTVSGNIINIYRAYVTGDFSNPAFPVVVSGTPPTGLNVDTVFVNDAALAAERDQWLFYWNERFVFTGPEKAKDFFEEQVFRPFGYPKILNTGEMAARKYRPAHPGLPPLTLDENDIITVSPLKSLQKDHINRIRIWGDHDEVNDTFETLLFEFEDAADIAKTGESPIFELFSRGLRSDLDGKRIAIFASNKIIQRFLNPPLEFTSSVMFKKRALEVGNVTRVTHKSFPNLTDGTLGWINEPCEVTRVNTDFAKGLVNLTLLTTNFGQRYRVIAENDLDKYQNQTDEEREKNLSIANTGTVKFDNGDDAHQIM